MTFEEVSRYFQTEGSIKGTARNFNISESKCRKILVTTGDYSSPLTEKVAKLMESGLSAQEIGAELGKSSACIGSNSPYSKGLYNSDDPSANALRIRECRVRKMNDGG